MPTNTSFSFSFFFSASYLFIYFYKLLAANIDRELVSIVNIGDMGVEFYEEAVSKSVMWLWSISSDSVVGM